jgi:hypothetical protein
MKKTILILLTLVTVICSCRKDARELPQQQNKACELSDKYTADSFYLHTDTLWIGINLAQTDLQRVANTKEQWYLLCTVTPVILECRRYVIGDKITQPIIFK